MVAEAPTCFTSSSPYSMTFLLLDQRRGKRQLHYQHIDTIFQKGVQYHRFKVGIGTIKQKILKYYLVQ